LLHSISCREERYLSDSTLDIKKLYPPLLTIPDNNYWSFGDKVGDAWKDGVALKEQFG